MLEILRGLTRPVLTFAGLAGAVLLLFMGRDVPEWLITQVAMMIAWWFADRSRRENNG